MREPRVSNAAVVTKPAINLYYKQSSVLIRARARAYYRCARRYECAPLLIVSFKQRHRKKPRIRILIRNTRHVKRYSAASANPFVRLPLINKGADEIAARAASSAAKFFNLDVLVVPRTRVASMRKFLNFHVSSHSRLNRRRLRRDAGQNR